MPLTMAQSGETYSVKSIHGRSSMHKHLESLGLVPGSMVHMIARTPSGLILSVKGSRIAIGYDIANRVLV
ncbi:MAG: FeoA family protein [Eggerthellaceae bacterium]|jgi:ferrous iron transport protein A